MKTQFYDDLGFVLRVILVSQIDEKSIDESRDFEGIPGDTPESGNPPSEGNASVHGPYCNIETDCKKT